MIIIGVNRWNRGELSWFSKMMAKTLLANNHWGAQLERLSRPLQQRSRCSQIWQHKSSLRWWFLHLMSRVKIWKCKSPRSVKTTYFSTDNVQISHAHNAPNVEPSTRNERVRVWRRLKAKICSDDYQSSEVCRGRLSNYHMVVSGSRLEEQNCIKTSEAEQPILD